LLNGELRFGLPAALIVLLLVFGTVVAGMVPLLMALVAITTALGIVALLTQVFELSVFTTNMLTGMGLALGIDYALFVISGTARSVIADGSLTTRSWLPVPRPAAQSCSAGRRS
jgi:uncharacterized membrane protein YdfJ with MMPL/SSD domain